MQDSRRTNVRTGEQIPDSPAQNPDFPDNSAMSRFAGAVAASMLLVLAAPGTAHAVDPNPIDTTSRAAVRQAYVDRWLPAVTTPIAPAGGSTSSCTPYTTPAAQQVATASAINFARGLAGEGAVRLVGTYNDQAAKAALIMAANKALSHEPPSTWQCWTSAGRDAAGRSNLQLSSGTASAARVAETYLDDPGSGNTAAGHRRWLLRPEATTMGSGNALGDWLANDLYVFTFADDDASAPARRYYAWPSAGWFPSPLEPAGRWSLSSSTGANFANATVRVTRTDGTSVPSTKRAVQNGYGDNTLVWDLATPPEPVVGTGEAAYDVTVSGITGGPSSSYTYRVRLFDPTVDVETSGPVRTTTGVLLSRTTARRNSTRIRVTMLVKAADGTQPTGTVALWSNGRRVGSYPVSAGDAGTRVVTLGPFRRAGVRKVYAVYRGSASYLGSRSQTKAFTVR